MHSPHLSPPAPTLQYKSREKQIPLLPYWDMSSLRDEWRWIEAKCLYEQTTLLQGNPKKLLWAETAKMAFEKLKPWFNTAPILKHPDPNVPFVAELGRSSPNDRESPRNCSPELFTHKNSPQLKQTMMSATVNCYQLKRHWRNGNTGLRG